MTDPRFPIGEFQWPERIGPEDRHRWMDRIEATPALLRKSVEGLSQAQLDTPYRDGGWTIRQVVHHIPDSHLNSYVRYKLALTEDTPVIKPYDEAAWARLIDTSSTPVETSLILLEALHERWLVLLRSLSEADWKKSFRHPERGLLTLEQNLSLYGWHGDHHIAHITSLRAARGW